MDGSTHFLIHRPPSHWTTEKVLVTSGIVTLISTRLSLVSNINLKLVPEVKWISRCAEECSSIRGRCILWITNISSETKHLSAQPIPSDVFDYLITMRTAHQIDTSSEMFTISSENFS